MAAELKVRVVDQRTGEPLHRAAVCLGTDADKEQFGAKRTASDGVAAFSDVPEIPLVLTVSKSPFRGYQSRPRAMSFNRTIMVPMPIGGLGPVCMAAAADADAPGRANSLSVSGFRINQDERQTTSPKVTMSFGIFGTPTHYRASENPNFVGADWVPFQSSPSFQLSPGAGEKTLYFQVRRYSKVAGASMEALSEVVSDAILVTRP
jgi:hypothetical protein